MPTPYRVWVSEIMLQQTQVATVLPYFERFLEAFPSVEALANAPEAQVLTLWSGLGYYRRARLLHQGAKVVMRDHGGQLPATVDALRALPGVGRYTAGAIASIAFGVRAAVLDGNVARVLSRVFALDEPVNASAGERRLWALAEGLVPDDASTHNQALMELGALVCSPRTPACPECPLRPSCSAHALGRPTAYPVKRARAAPTRVHAVAALIQRGDEVLLAKRPAGTLLGGLWELPGGELEAPRAPRKKALAEALAERLGLNAEIGDLVGTIAHQFTHRTLTLEVFRATVVGEATPRAFYDDARWLPADAGAAVPISTLTRKALTLHPGVQP
jgi:A/G-specific adenine glycosylase